MANVRDDDPETLEFADESEWIDDEDCEHDCGDGCWEYGDGYCHHQHICHCGRCGCPGYCDDYQTYNLRPAETGGA